MDTEDILALYATVAEITDQMLVAARTADWERLVILESHCTSQVESIKQHDQPQQPLTHEAREKKTRIIRKILDDDRQIRDLTEPWMKQLAALIDSTAAARKLSQTYGAAESG